MRLIDRKDKILAGILTAILAPLVFCMRIFGRRSPGGFNDVRSILVVEFWRLGDLVMLTAPIRGLRKQYPHAHIDLVASSKANDIFKGNPDINNIIAFEAPWISNKYNILKYDFAKILELFKVLRNNHYDIAIAYRGDFRDNGFIFFSGAARTIGYGFAGGSMFLTDKLKPDSKKCHQVDQFLAIDKYLGVDIEGLKPELYVTSEEMDDIEKTLSRYGVLREDFLVVVHPDVGSSFRLWPAASFVEVINHLIKQRSAKVIIVRGDKKDTADIVSQVVNGKNVIALSNLTLRQLIALYKRCSLAIGVDSGPAHIASGVGTPSVTIFGPQKAEWFKPYGDNCAVVQSKTDCSPCRQTVCETVPSCMERVLPAEVIKAADAMISKIRGGRG